MWSKYKFYIIGVVALVLLVGGVAVVRRKMKKKKEEEIAETPAPLEASTTEDTMSFNSRRAMNMASEN